MTQQNSNNVSPLQFYPSTDYQMGNRPYSYNTSAPLELPMGHIPSFVISSYGLTSEISLKKLYLYDALDDTPLLDITDWANTQGMWVQEEPTDPDKYRQAILMPYTEYRPGKTDVVASDDLGSGTYYLLFEDPLGETRMYSDTFKWFTYDPNVGRILMIYGSNSDLLVPEKGRTLTIPFSKSYPDSSGQEKPFSLGFYVGAWIGKPEYIFEEEATKRNGYSFVEKQISDKVNKFSFLAQESLCDAMRIIRMCDNVQVIDNYYTYKAIQFLATPTWEVDSPVVAKVEVEFKTDSIVKAIGSGAV